jgi:type I restriction enzyme S subunit
MSFSEWKKYRIGDILDVKHGFAFKGEFFSSIPTENILLTPGNFHIGGGFKDEKFKYYLGVVPDEYVLSEGDIIVTMTDLSKDGDTIGYPAKVPFKKGRNFLHNQRLGLLIFKSTDVSKDFVYWALRTNQYHLFIANSVTGTTVKHTSPSRIKEYEFYAPAINIQNKIAAILNSIDEKIENNLAINLALEEIAQTLFKEWFVNFNYPHADRNLKLTELGEIPESWKVVTLGDIAVQVKENIKPSNYPQKEFHHYSLPAFDSDELPSKDKGSSILSNKTAIKKYSVLFSKLNPRIPRVWSIGDIDEDVSICSTEFICLKPKQNFFYSYLNYFLKQPELVTKLTGIATGTSNSHQRIKPTDLLELEILIPDYETVNKFEKIVKPILDTRFHKILENQHLKITRDSLLPKLMSGEIEING